MKINHKLLYKFIIVALAIIVMQTKYSYAGCASDGGGPIPAPKLPDLSAKLIEKPTTSSIFSEAEKQKIPEKKIEKTENILQPPKKELTQQAPPEKKGSFWSAIFNMFTLLFKIIVLILLIYGGILLYRKLKAIKGYPEAQGDIPEANTISEAVASYVRHKIKRST